MKKRRGVFLTIVLSTIMIFGLAAFMESAAWARAGGGMSSGSRGGRSFSAPSAPPSRSPSSPGMSTPGRPGPSTGFPGATNPSGGFGRSPFWSGLAGGVAGGFLGNMLFGGRGYAGGGVGGGGGGGGFPLMDLLILGVIGYFVMRYFKRRRMEAGGSSYFNNASTQDTYGQQPYSPQQSLPVSDEVTQGFEQVMRYDPALTEEAFKELAQDMFFRIQAGWMNRSLDGIESLLTPEMSTFFSGEFSRMKQKGTINRLENIAVRKVEPSEVWQEAGKDYVTVLFTANLLDYTVDEKTGQVVEGDKLNPVKFLEYWTFTRDTGPTHWKLSAINQPGQPGTSMN